MHAYEDIIVNIIFTYDLVCFVLIDLVPFLFSRLIAPTLRVCLRICVTGIYDSSINILYFFSGGFCFRSQLA